MTPGSREWVVRSLRDWALGIGQGMALVTYRSDEARDDVLLRLSGEFQGLGFTAEALRCKSIPGSQQFVSEITSSGAQMLFVLDADRLLFGENGDHSPFWINFHRETITSHQGAQIWWMSPRAAVRFGQTVPDLARFFLFREELTEVVTASTQMFEVPQPIAALFTGSENLAEELLRRARKAAESPQADRVRIWLELALPAIGEFLSLRQVSRASAALREMTEAAGPPDAALGLDAQKGNAEQLEKAATGSGWDNLSSIYSILGKREEALRAAERSAEIFSQLVGLGPNRFRLEGGASSEVKDAFLPHLASSLNNLANRQSDMGQRAKALETAREAADLHRELVNQNQEAFLPNLASSLNNLANRQSEVGLRAEALETAREAASHHRELVKQNHDIFLPALATSLNNLANMQTGLSLRTEALETAREAAELTRELVKRNRDAFLPDLAMTFNNLAAAQRDVGLRVEALETAREAADLRRELVKQNRGSFLPALASSLNNLAAMQRDVGLRAEALETVREAVDLRRELVKQNRHAFLPDLAMSLNNLAAMQRDVSLDAEALETALEAADLYRELAKQNNDAFLPNLAGCLDNLAAMQSKVGLHAEAMEIAQEAADLRRELVRRNRDAFLPDMAASLNNLANRQSGVGLRGEALKTARHAANLYRELVKQNREVFLPHLVTALGTFGYVLGEQAVLREESIEGIGYLEEAIGLLTPMLLKLPEAYKPLMAFLVRLYIKLTGGDSGLVSAELLAPVLPILAEESKVEGLLDASKPS